MSMMTVTVMTSTPMTRMAAMATTTMGKWNTSAVMMTTSYLHCEIGLMMKNISVRISAFIE
jgi:hypothetical protein